MSTFNVPFTERVFQEGEKLRLTVEQWADFDAGQTGTVFFGNSSKGLVKNPDEQVTTNQITFGDNPSTLQFQVPFKILI